MRVLLDTHAMLWWLRADPRLSARAAEIIGDGDSELLWSLASSWEISVKLSIGKLEIGRPLHRLFAEIVTEQGATPLAITHDHCARVAELPLLHRDPFDRMLVAQAQGENVPILSADAKVRAYDVQVLW